jgi:outer membrane immunogenic protein
MTFPSSSRAVACTLLAIASAGWMLPTGAKAQVLPDQSDRTASWTGFYLGAGGGLGALTTSLDATPGPAVTDPGAAGASASLDGLGADGSFLTLSAGADYQVSSRFVAGAFVDVDFYDLETQIAVTIPGIGVAAKGGLDVDHAWSVGARLGYLASPETLLFVSGGYTRLGITEIGANVSGPFPTIAARASAPSADGVFIGAGFEAMLTRHISLRGEYRYMDFGSGQIDLPIVQGLNLNDYAVVEAAADVQTGRLSLNYRF